MNKTIDEKNCTKCKLLKPLTEYPKQKRRPDGAESHCKECYRIYSRDVHYPKNKELIRVQSEQYRKANWDKIKEQTYKRYDPQKHKARMAVNNAVKAGKFEKADCQECGSIKTDFHHTSGYDIENYFVGVWLCRPDHAKLHAKLRRAKWATA